MQKGIGKMMRNIFRILILAVLIGSGVFMFRHLVNTRSGPVRISGAEKKVPVRTVKCRIKDVFPGIASYGTVRFSRQVNIIAEAAGKVISRSPDLKEGSYVRKGQFLLKTDPEDYLLAIAGLSAEIQRLDAQLEEIHTTRKFLKENLAVELDSLGLAETDLKRQEELIRKKAVSDVKYEAAKRAYLLQKQKCISVRSQVELLPAKIREVQAMINAAGVKLKQAYIHLERTSIVVPFDSIVGKVRIEEGQFIMNGERLFQLSGVSQAEIYCEIPISEFGILVSGFKQDRFDFSEAAVKSLGIDVSVTQIESGKPVNLKAELVRINHELDARSRRLTLIVNLQDPFEGKLQNALIFPGDLVKVGFRSNSTIKGFILPRMAVDGNRVRTVSSESRIQYRTLKILYRTEEYLIADSGLVDGEEVIITEVLPDIEGLFVSSEIDQAWQQKIDGFGGRND